jgi:hypothetical protein
MLATLEGKKCSNFQARVHERKPTSCLLQGNRRALACKDEALKKANR